MIVSGNPLLQELDAAFTAAEGEAFEDGMESALSKSILASLDRDCEKAMDAMEFLLNDAAVHPEVAAESLRWLGAVDHAPSRERRRRLLERCLSRESYVVRDAAVVGLSYMDERISLPAVRAALTIEPESVLRRDMQRLIDRWEALP